MHFDVPKVVRSPGCDHGHDEESRNGRDINIDILEAYIDILDFTGLPGGYGNPPGVIWALLGLSGKVKGLHTRAARLPPPLVLLGLGEVSGPPLSLSPSGIPSPTRIGGGGVLLPEGVGLLLACPMMAGRPPSFEALYTETRDTPRETG